MEFGRFNGLGALLLLLLVGGINTSSASETMSAEKADVYEITLYPKKDFAGEACEFTMRHDEDMIDIRKTHCKNMSAEARSAKVKGFKSGKVFCFMGVGLTELCFSGPYYSGDIEVPEFGRLVRTPPLLKVNYVGGPILRGLLSVSTAPRFLLDSKVHLVLGSGDNYCVLTVAPPGVDLAETDCADFAEKVTSVYFWLPAGQLVLTGKNEVKELMVIYGISERTAFYDNVKDLADPKLEFSGRGELVFFAPDGSLWHNVRTIHYSRTVP